jgi:hypothetical protein
VLYFARLSSRHVAMEACGGGGHHIGHHTRLSRGSTCMPIPSWKITTAQMLRQPPKSPPAGRCAGSDKSGSQQEWQLLQRQRTEIANRSRAILAEFGITLPKRLHRSDGIGAKTICHRQAHPSDWRLHCAATATYAPC